MVSLTLREKVAQLLILGTDPEQALEDLEPFYATGLGGFIGFRHHFQPFSDAHALKKHLAEIQSRFRGAGLSFMSLDQEGGQVERLPHWLFPSGVNAIHLAPKSPHWVERMALEQAQRLRWLGFNLNYTPVLDINTQWLNPIIGVRSFGQDKQVIIERSIATMQSYLAAGILPVGKHFPGHGSGTIDSHLDLPCFETWNEDEWVVYEALIKANLPAILVAHGLYPKLAQWTGADPTLPASLSPAFYQTLLRDKLGFTGLIMTDDLMMGALKSFGDPGEISVQAVKAGADLLIWRRAQDEGLIAYEALVRAFEKGVLDESRLDNTIQRIFQTRDFLNKKTINCFSDDALSPDGCHQQSRDWARQTISVVKHLSPSPLPINRFTQWALVSPDISGLIHYRDDTQSPSPQSNSLADWGRKGGLEPTYQATYSANKAPSEDKASELFTGAVIDVIVFVAFNSALNSHQQDYVRQLQIAHPSAKLVLVSAGMPSDGDVIEGAWTHIALPSYRPAAMEALIELLGTGKNGSGSV